MNSIFVGIRIFKHLNLLLVRFDPISLMRGKPQKVNSPRFLHFQTSKAMYNLQQCGIVFFDEGS